MFPSPCGDYGSYLLPGTDGRIIRQLVSVPLRGLWFLSREEAITTYVTNRFRPLAGIMVLI